MLDEGIEKDAVEDAAVRMFNTEKGFLALFEDAGVEKALALMELLSGGSPPEDPFAAKYDNFFSPPKSLKDWKPEPDQSAADGDNKIQDFVLLDFLGMRFLGVLFMAAVDLVESGVLGIEDVEALCKYSFGWTEGPFAMMNRMGIEESLRIVTKKMELSHRQEINFPIPRLLLEQARLQKPWMLPS